MPIARQIIPAIQETAPRVRYLNQIPQGVPTTTTPVQVGGLSSDPVGGMGLDTGAFGGAAQTHLSLDWTIGELVQMFVVYAFIAAAALSAVFIFVGGINFILSGGNDEKIKQAVNTIRYSIVGLVVTILSFTFVAIVGRIFGLNFVDYLSYQEIKNSINRLIQTGQPTAPNSFEIIR